MAFNSKLDPDLKNPVQNETAFGNVLRGIDTNKDGNSTGRTVAIGVTASVAVLLVLLCASLTYKQLKRRRLETGYFAEVARREVIRKAIKQKIEQLTRTYAEDPTCHRELMASKVPLVTFGNVTNISTKYYPLELKEALKGQSKCQSKKHKHLLGKDNKNDSRILHPDKTDGHLPRRHHYKHGSHRHHRKDEQIDSYLLYNSQNNDGSQEQNLQHENMNGLLPSVHCNDDIHLVDSLQLGKIDVLLSGENFSNEGSQNLCLESENVNDIFLGSHNSDNTQNHSVQAQRTDVHLQIDEESQGLCFTADPIDSPESKHHSHCNGEEYNLQSDRTNVHPFDTNVGNDDVQGRFYQAVTHDDHLQNQNKVHVEQEKLRPPSMRNTQNISQSRSHSNIRSHSPKKGCSETRLNMIKHPIQSHSSPCIVGMQDTSHRADERHHKWTLNLKTPLSSPMKRKVFPCSELPKTTGYNCDEMVNLSFVE